MGGEMKEKLEKLTGRTDVQIESARNGRRKDDFPDSIGCNF